MPWRNPHFVSYLQNNRFALLLIGLFALMFYGSIMEAFTPRVHGVVVRLAVGLLLAYMMFAATLALGSMEKKGSTGLWLAIPAILLELVDLALLTDVTQALSHVSGMVFIGYVVVRILLHIFKSERVTSETIYASLCTYLLLATFWMFGYSLLEVVDEGAFAYSQIDDKKARIMRLGKEPAGIELYFSLVTMTTLGYGDVVPVSPAARSLSSLQAVLGQLYLAVLVARLVGLHVAESARKRE